MSRRSPEQIQKQLTRRIIRNWLFALLIALLTGGLMGYIANQSWNYAIIGASGCGAMIGTSFVFAYLLRKRI